MIPGERAGRPGFVDLAVEAFAFLVPLGFTVARRDETLVCFEKNDVFVNVYHGRSSFQVGLEMGRHDGDMYSLHELLSAVAPADIGRAQCQTTVPEILARCLALIAETIERNCGALLTGDANEFAKLGSVVSPLRRAATVEAQFGAIVDRADRAWESKDFSEAAGLYEKSLPALDKTRMRRLDYLRKQKDNEKK